MKYVRDKRPQAPRPADLDGLQRCVATARRGDRGNFALPAAHPGDVDCLRFSVSLANAAITDSPIAMNRAQGPSTPTLWQLTRAPSSNNHRLSASKSELAS